ncbi:integrase core domain protein-like protein [Leptotrombidium deliense]|uniref:Integrase core domain protein-like protein n=1 Tax=Leptotrombidium deliense TaxID=299467 RepID=A0A443S2Z7_9ACAR|nr:integrase core domain protein-like protein [Leptotrombidium deliense]
MEPTCFNDAVKSKNCNEWLQAMNDEMSSLAKNNTWKLVEKPKNINIINNRWVYKIKENTDGSVSRFKARLVAKGYTQKQGIDFNETFSPVVKMNSVRAILVIAASEDLEMIQFDVKTAFLYGDIKETLYMKQPDGFDDGSGKVCKLQKSLYGLKQAPRQWNEKFNSFLQKFGFSRSKADSCVYASFVNNVKTILGIYVDDGLLVSSSKQKINEIVLLLKEQFEMSVAVVDCFLGLQVIRNRKKKLLNVNQQSYIRKMLVKYNMEDCKSVKTPMDASVKLVKSNCKSCQFPYRELIGSLMYAMLGSRIDICYTVGKLAQFLDCFDETHWTAAKRVLRYLKGTSKHGITFNANSNGPSLYGYCDADYAGDLDSRRSTSGYVFILSGGAVSWMSRVQRIVALSTTEAEYIALAEATKEAFWMRQLLSDFGNEQTATNIWCDNQGAIKLVGNPEFHQRTKHIDVRHNFIRDAQSDGKIVVKLLIF